jgi:hypothetical protein
MKLLVMLCGLLVALLRWQALLQQLLRRRLLELRCGASWRGLALLLRNI